MRLSIRPLYLAAVLALPLLASCSDQPKATDPDKTATVVPTEAMKASDSTAVKADSAAR